MTFQLYLLFDNLESKHLFQHSKWRKGSPQIDHVGSAESYFLMCLLFVFVFVFCLYRWMLVYMLGMPMMLFMKGWSANFSIISLSTVCPLGKKVHFSSTMDHLEYMVSVSFDVVNCKKSNKK
jgi:hypothetical protein